MRVSKTLVINSNYSQLLKSSTPSIRVARGYLNGDTRKCSKFNYKGVPSSSASGVETQKSAILRHVITNYIVVCTLEIHKVEILFVF